MNIDERIAAELKSRIHAELAGEVMPSFRAVRTEALHSAAAPHPAPPLRAVLAVLTMTLLAAFFALPGMLATGSPLLHLRLPLSGSSRGWYLGQSPPPMTKQLPPYSHAPLLPCGSVNSITAYLVQLKSGVAAGSFHPAGFLVIPLLPFGTNGKSGLAYVIPPTSGPLSGAVLRSSPAVETAGPVYEFPRERQYLSCYYHLTDIPLAAPFVAAARASLVKAGYITSTTAPSDIADYLHDDPLLPGGLIVQVDYDGALLPRAPGMPTGITIHGTDGYLCIENSSHEVLATAAIPAGHA